MKRFFTLIALLAIYAIPSTAQELPFTIGCMADEDKPLEIAFCEHLFAAAQAHQFIRPSTADDASALIAVVIPKQDGEVAAVAVHVAFSSRSMPGLSFSIVTGCDIITGDNTEERAVEIVGWMFLHGARWLVDAPDRMPNFAPIKPPGTLRLETSPP